MSVNAALKRRIQGGGGGLAGGLPPTLKFRLKFS